MVQDADKILKNVLGDLEADLNELFQIECDAADAMMKIRFGPSPTRISTYVFLK